MAKIGSLDKLSGRIDSELRSWEWLHSTKEAAAWQQRQTALLQEIQTFGKSGSVADILGAEEVLLKTELTRFGRENPELSSSLQSAFVELAQARLHDSLVQDPDKYKTIDDGHGISKNRIGGLPKDEARQFFANHKTRLLNMGRYRNTVQDRDLLQARKANILIAEKLYKAAQKKALGLEMTPAKSRDRSR